MENSKAYDLPVRIFHWTFASLFVISFFIAKVIDDESSLYAYHMLSGILMASMVVLRILWGFVGSRTSRFSSFRLAPTQLRSYFSTITSSSSRRYLGHNPASSYAAVLMMLFSLGLVFSGLMMSFGVSKHFFEEVHEVLGTAFLIVVILHIAGVIFHQYRHKDGMSLSMINGLKARVEGESDIGSNHPVVAMVFILFIVGMGSYLLNGFDGNTGRLNAFGSQIRLGENEEKEHGGEQRGYSEKNEDEDEDEDDDD